MIACFLMPQIAIATERSRIPGLWGEPLALTTEEGLLLCVSDEARVYGVEPGQKCGGAKALCPNLRLLPYERSIYEQAAALIWDALAIESSLVQPVSPEICYAELDDRHVAPRIRAFAGQLSAAAKTPIHVGLACSKITARHAALQAPVGEPVLVYSGCESSLLADVAITAIVGNIPEMDAAMLRRLDKLGIRTLGDLHTIPNKTLSRAVGRMSVRLSRIAIGLDGDPVIPTWPRPILTFEQSFEFEQTSIDMVHQAIRRCTVRLERALRARREYACLLTLSLIREDTTVSRQEERLPGPTQSGEALYCAALRLMNRMAVGNGQEEWKLVAVRLDAADLTIPSGLQLELMDVHGNQMPAETHRRIQATIAYLRSRFGIGAVLTAATLHRARRIDFWISPFCHQLNEAVEVIEGADGRPVRFWRRQKLYYVRAILNDWCETCWVWNELIRTTIYRIETEPCGLFELRRLGTAWRLTAAQD